MMDKAEEIAARIVEYRPPLGPGAFGVLMIHRPGGTSFISGPASDSVSAIRAAIVAACHEYATTLSSVCTKCGTESERGE